MRCLNCWKEMGESIWPEDGLKVCGSCGMYCWLLKDGTRDYRGECDEDNHEWVSRVPEGCMMVQVGL